MKIKAGPIPLKSKLLIANKKYNQRISKYSPKFYKNCGVEFIQKKWYFTLSRACLTIRLWSIGV